MEPLQGVGDGQISKDQIRATVAAEIGCAAVDVADHDDLIQLGLNSIRMMALAGGWRKRGRPSRLPNLRPAPRWNPGTAYSAPAQKWRQPSQPKRPVRPTW